LTNLYPNSGENNHVQSSSAVRSGTAPQVPDAKSPQCRKAAASDRNDRFRHRLGDRMMTDEELLALNKECLEKGRDLDYELGRTTAKKYLANGMAEKVTFEQIREIFGQSYANGYQDYVTAYRVMYR
jgi:hypothetical protein